MTEEQMETEIASLKSQNQRLEKLLNACISEYAERLSLAYQKIGMATAGTPPEIFSDSVYERAKK